MFWRLPALERYRERLMDPGFNVFYEPELLFWLGA
jgi:hypothetical protein